MSASERTPLLSSQAGGSGSPSTSRSPSTTSAPTTHPRPTLSAPVPNSAAGLILTEDDIAIEGMVLALLAELNDRGYVVPPGLPTLPPDMPREEADAEIAFLRSVFGVPRHRHVLDKYLPDSSRNAGGNGAASGGANGFSPNGAATPVLPGSIMSTNRSAVTPAGRRGGNTPHTASSASSLSNASTSSSQTLPARPSPLSSQVLDTTVVTSPSALFLAALLSLLISLQAEYRGSVEETDPGVDGELRMFKARRELGERMYAVVGGLLDSYLVAGDARQHHEGDDDADDEDALVTLLFRDFPLHYDSMDRATCSLDLLLTLSSAPLVEAEDLVSHPVVLASTEYVWRNGLLPAPKRGVRSLTWKESCVRLDRFAVPRILHNQTYILSTVHAFITVYILMFSAYSHFYAFNALATNIIHVPEGSGARQAKGWGFIPSLVWWLWVAGVFGWAGEVGRAWLNRGPQSSLPLSPSTLLPLLHHALVFVSLLFRILAFYIATPRHRPTFMLATSLSLLAWSIPFLAASRVLPQNLPSFGTPTHQEWSKIRDGRKRRDVGYRPPPKRVPESHRALRSLESNLGGLVQFSTYFAVFGLLTLWSLSGDIDYPSALLNLLHLPLVPLQSWATFRDQASMTATNVSRTPLEARTTLAFTLILGAVLAYFSGGRPSVSPKPAHASAHLSSPRRELDDLDGWDRYGREVAFRSRRERLAVNRYFTYVPLGAGRGGQRRLESLASAFSTPPLPSPLNLAIPPLLLVCSILKRVVRFRIEQRRRWATVRGRFVENGDARGEHETLLSPGQEAERAARRLQEVVRLWVWRIGISPLGGWAIAAKGIRRLRGKE